jgi:hypothetical protein
LYLPDDVLSSDERRVLHGRYGDPSPRKHFSRRRGLAASLRAVDHRVVGVFTIAATHAEAEYGQEE